MSKDLNRCDFIGRLGKNVEMRYTPSGTAVANISIACSDDYKEKSGNEVKQTNWIRVVAFNRLAEIMGEYLSKGSQIYISGKLVNRKYQDKNGQDRYTTEIVASEMQMLDTRSNSGDAKAQAQADHNNRSQPNQPQSQQNQTEDFDDDIPF